MSITSLLGIARDSLLAQTAGIDVSGQNVANVNTPGYVKRGVVLETRPMLGATPGGVQWGGITRAYDKFAQGRLVGERAKFGAAEARSGALETLESILAPGSGQSVGDKANAFFASLDGFAQNASDPTARAQVLAQAESLSESVRSTADGIAGARSDLFGKASGVAGEINQRLAKIASYNEQIAQAQGTGVDASDLRDQRDQLVTEVSDRIEVQSVENEDGSVTLLSSGSSLVEKGRASSVSVDLDSAGDLSIKFQKPGGAVTDVTARVTGGALGGLKEARDVDMKKSAAALDQFAFDLTNAVNAVHTTGVGLDGQTGRPLFAPAASAAGAARAMAVDVSVKGAPNRLAGATNAGQLPSGNAVALSLASLSTSPLGSAGSPAEAFGALAADVGVRKQAADSELDLREASVAQATNARESASGVSVDEEMVNLTRYQRAFEASMKVLRTADELLAGLIRELG